MPSRPLCRPKARRSLKVRDDTGRGSCVLKIGPRTLWTSRSAQHVVSCTYSLPLRTIASSGLVQRTPFQSYF